MRLYYPAARSYVISFPRSSLYFSIRHGSIVVHGCSQPCFDGGGGTRAGREGKTKHWLIRGGLAVLSLLLENAGSSRDVLRAKKRLAEDEGMKERLQNRERCREGYRGRKRERGERKREIERRSCIATRAHVCATTSQADTDDGRPCLVTSPARLDGIHLFVRPLPAPFAD